MMNSAVLLLAASLWIFACQEEKKSNPARSPADETCSTALNSRFSLLDPAVSTVVSENCVSCHSSKATSDKQQQPYLDSQSAITNYKERILGRALEDQDMPPAAPLDDKDLTTLEQWKDVETTSSSSSHDDTADSSAASGQDNTSQETLNSGCEVVAKVNTNTSTDTDTESSTSTWTSHETSTGTSTSTSIQTVTQVPVEKTDETAPFGGTQDVVFSQILWAALAQNGLAGERTIRGLPVPGAQPHGAIVEILEATITAGTERSQVVIKYNYGGEGIDASKVSANPDQWLKAITVMFSRFAGYDTANKNLFWAKYKPDGSLFENDTQIPLAGRIGKGSDKGCIACHKSAGGGDYIFRNDPGE